MAFMNLIMGSTKVSVIVVLLSLICAASANAVRPDCKKMREELTELRLEYHDFAKGNHDTWSEITFKRVCEILDEIVQLKQRMRESNCTPMSRKKNLEKALKEREANATKKDTSGNQPRGVR